MLSDVIVGRALWVMILSHWTWKRAQDTAQSLFSAYPFSEYSQHMLRYSMATMAINVQSHAVFQ